jgi:nucleotide-binding universal stress UspA family protein/GNAT superfamily N-acetyltransferase
MRHSALRRAAVPLLVPGERLDLTAYTPACNARAETPAGLACCARSRTVVQAWAGATLASYARRWAMSTPSRRRTITLRDGARVALRPIASGDKPLLAAVFERLSEESRYRRFFTTKKNLSAAELDYFVDVDHRDHEAIVAIDPSSGECLGVARFIRALADAESAEVAVTVADDWQRRGLGRALLNRLTYRARQEGVRRFTALVQGDNLASLGLLSGAGKAQRRSDTGVVELIVELPAKRGMGVRLGRALRAAAAGGLVPAKTLVDRLAVAVESSPRPPVDSDRPIRTIVVGVDGSETGAKSLAVTLELAAALRATVHVVSAYGAVQTPADAEAALAAATRTARAEGLEAVTHARSDDPVEALVAVAQEQDADLLVVGSNGASRVSRFLVGSVAHKVSHHAPCSVLMVHTDQPLLRAQRPPAPSGPGE